MPETIDEPLLDAGQRALREFGYSATTLERIAQQAGVSRVTLHRRGITKDRLVAALAERATEQYRRALWPALTAPGSGAERLRAALTALCDAAEENLELLTALAGQTDTVFHERGPQALTRSVYTEPLERLLRDGAADGSLRSVDPIEYATVLFNLVGWSYVHLRTGHGWSPEGARRPTLDVALNGLATAGADGQADSR